MLPMSRTGQTAAFLLLLASAAAAQVRAGAARAIITPDLHGHPVYLAGFGHNRLATAVHDDLEVRCVAIGIHSNTVVLCAADLIGLFYDDVQRIRTQFASSSPHAFLIVTATHVHEGPDTLGLWGPTPNRSGMDPAYLDFIDGKIAGTAAQAVRAMQPAHLEAARDDHPLLAQLQSVDRPPYIKDPHLVVLRLAGANGAIATLVNWSDHPETLGRRNTAITADYPHWLRESLDRQLGGTTIFFNAAPGKVSTLGAQVALLDPETGEVAPEGSWRKPQLLGETLAQLVVRALAHPQRLAADRLMVLSRRIFLPLANQHFRAAEGEGIFAGRKPLFTRGQRDDRIAKQIIGRMSVPVAQGEDLDSEVDYIQLQGGRGVLAEFATVPGEIYPELVDGGMARYPGADFPDAPFEPALREKFRSPFGMVLGLANDELGYLIPKCEWDEQSPWLQNAPRPYYGEVNSAGPDAARVVLEALTSLMSGH